MPTHTFALATAGVGTAVLAVTGITYSSPSGATSASPSVHHAAAPVQRPAQPVQRVIKPVQRAAPAGVPEGDGRSGSEKEDEGRDREGGGGGYSDEEGGRIYFNERTYSASADGCITAASGPGSSSFSIFNDSRKTVEVFRGFTCDNDAPVATVSPHGSTNGIVTSTAPESLFGDDGVVGSFRVISDEEW